MFYSFDKLRSFGGDTYYGETPWIGAVYLFTTVLTFVWLGMMQWDFLLLFGRNLKLNIHLSMAFVLSLRHLPTTVVLVVILAAAVILTEIFPLFMMFLPAAYCWLTDKWLVKIGNQYLNLLEESAK